MKTKTIYFLSLIMLPFVFVTTHVVAACKSKFAKGSTKSVRPEITAEETKTLVSRFDLAGWNAGGEEFDAKASRNAVRT